MGRASGHRPARKRHSHPPGPRPAARDRVWTILHRGIVAGTIPGGTRLVQARIAEEFGVGTGSVREALRELAAGGFVRFDADRVAVVHQLSRTELAVELLAAMEVESDGQRWAEYNDSFHSVIEEAGSSPRLVAILENLRDLSALYVTHSIVSEPERAVNARAEHEEILEAVIARDPEAAADAMFRHLDGRLRTLLTVHQVGEPRRGRTTAS
jgi:DNA-binding GntR family transcriptional regulator